MRTRVAVLLVGLSVATVLGMYLYVMCVRHGHQRSFYKEHSARLTAKPVIGVLAQLSYRNYQKKHGGTFFFSSYARYLEIGGALVVPIRVLLPGGQASLDNSLYVNVTQLIVAYATQAYDRGDYFPVFGTCLGFQALVNAVAKVKVTSQIESVLVNLKFHPHRGYRDSRLFGSLPQDLDNIMTTEKLFIHHHTYGVLLQNYNDNERLKKFFKVLVSDETKVGEPFVSLLEGRIYPIYAMQFHPEKMVFSHHFQHAIPNTYHGARVMAFFAQFTVNEARKNLHRFPSDAQRDSVTIDNHAEVSIREEGWNNDGLYVFKLRKH